MRKTKLVAAVLVSAGLLFGASGTALAAGNDRTPEPSPTVDDRRKATEDETRPAPAETTTPATKRPSGATPTAMPKEEGGLPVAGPARPSRGNPSFTG